MLDLVCPELCLHILENGKVSCLGRESKHDSLVVQPLASVNVLITVFTAPTDTTYQVPVYVKLETFFFPNATTCSYELSWSPLLAVAEV